MSEKRTQQLVDLRHMSRDELMANLAEQTAAYRKMCFRHAATPLPKGHLLRQRRRHIARLQTVLNQRPQANAPATEESA